MSECSRTVVLYDTPSMLRGRLVTPALPVWPAKDPADVRIYAVDYGPVLCGNAIRSVTARATPPLTPIQCSAAGSVVSLVLAGGADGQLARVEVTATMIDGQTDTRAILLPIVAQGILETEPVSASSATTTDTTPTVIAAVSVVGPGGSAVNIEGTVLARNVATGEACSFALTAIATQVGTPQAAVGQPSITAYAPPASLSACGLTVSVSGNVLTILATGIAGTAIVWTPNLHTTVA